MLLAHICHVLPATFFKLINQAPAFQLTAPPPGSSARVLMQGMHKKKITWRAARKFISSRQICASSFLQLCRALNIHSYSCLHITLARPFLRGKHTGAIGYFFKNESVIEISLTKKRPKCREKKNSTDEMNIQTSG